MDFLQQINITTQQLNANTQQLNTNREQLNANTREIEKMIKIVKIRNKINKKNNLQKNILNIMELYDIFSPILKEKYIIEKIINMKYDMETCKLRKQLKELN